ncbi:MAG: hypothetical protein A2W91_17800 [Bacteroidetes bacterium GWF2_38_335]|nr:MAG: hypothetical protein A2W91_17800 [Bacteroidetes bacterium GWF2_38_335]OFY78011.1 MAG: hypothetical protein A2281_18660 [Bacteroidetes bacterium RIFOXYA12_FULL_38_20]HBS88283.1 hypothetical protein [Bacteroidales bacterium]
MKKIYLTTNLIFAILLFSVLAGCYHDSDYYYHEANNYTGSNDDNKNKIDKAVLDYIVYKPGSYWIYYLDSLSTDTIMVDSLVSDSIPFNINRRTFYEERIRVYYHSTYYGFSFYDLASGRNEFVERIRNLSDSTFVSDYIFMNPPEDNTLLYFDWKDVYEVDGEDYYDVYKVTSPGNSVFYNSDTLLDEEVTMYHYFARDIGLIKRTNVDLDEKWILIEYDVYK